MARPSSRHGRYDAKVRSSAFDVNDNISAGFSCHAQRFDDRSERSDETEQQRSADLRRQLSLPLEDMENYPRRYSSGSDEGYVPSPPPRPPSAHRPRPASSRRLPGSARRPQPQPAEEELPDISILRPPSSFNKLRPLPSISSPTPSLDVQAHGLIAKVHDLDLADNGSHGLDSNKDTSLSEEKIKPVMRSNKNNSASSHTASKKYFSEPHPLPPEPDEQEGRLHLAVKLPTNGKRYNRYFSPQDYLQDLHHFAENMAEVDLSDYVLACNAPRKVFSNLTQRICDVGLIDKTVLYFEEKSDS